MKYVNQTRALDLLTQLVQIPSFINSANPQAEKPLENFIKDWFKINLPQYQPETIPFAKDRNNLFFSKGSYNWVFACHLDTVPPFKSSDLKVKKDGDRVYGLGTKDMKGGIVSTLLALQEIEESNKDSKAAVLFYGDEEYSQQGIRALEKSNGQIKKHKLMISPESRFALGLGARGMCVLKLRLKGQRAHSSRPRQGVDAIKAFYQLVEDTEDKFKGQTQLGKTTVTVVEIKGGLLTDDNIGVHHGTIPDVVDAALSLRVADLNFNVQELIEFIKLSAKKKGATIENVEILADYPARVTNLKQAEPIVKAIKKIDEKVEYSDPGTAGYNDAAILSEALGVPLVNFGPYGENNHNPNEWVSLKSVVNCANVFLKLMG